MVQLGSYASPHRNSISLAEALAIVARSYRAITGAETVALGSATNRILAADIAAPIAVPSADNSAVDGYAFRYCDLAASRDTTFAIVGTAAAGHPFEHEIGSHEAVRIFTGAVLPTGADTIVAQETVAASDASVSIPPDSPLGNNCRRAGEDIAPGSRIASAGDRLGPAEIGLLASVGVSKVEVRKLLKVAVFSTGDELRDDGSGLAAGQIHDSNRPVLLSLLKGLGIGATDLGILPDDVDTIRARLAEAVQGHDAVICSAGMSVGDEDHVKSAVGALGALDFWSVAIKPGRPIAVGHIGDTPFFGLPGNPVAMVVTFSMIVQPALLRLSGAIAETPRRFPVTADFAMTRKAGYREFLRCALHEGDGHAVLARRFPRGGSGVLSSIAASDGLLEIAEDLTEIVPGMTLPFIPFLALGL